jgi:PTH2 family peptidyl-tRNA hydrolase
MKQIILVRKDLKMPPGKISAQVAHGSVEAAFKSEKSNLDKWSKNGMKKVVLKVEDEKELLKYFKLAKQNNLVAVLIKDAGKTFFKKPTNTCVAIGPDDEGKIDKVTGKLKIL